MSQNTLLEKVFVQSKGNIVSDMDGEKVMLSIAKGKYYNLGEVGGDIWELMKEPISIEQIIASLMEQYDVEADVCQEQVVSFIAHLVEEGVIESRDV